MWPRVLEVENRMADTQTPFFRTKPVETIMEESREKKGGLKRVLSAVDLTAIGVGAMIGAGIFVLTGTAAKEHAGPAITLSYVFAGFACILAALCYAEFASRFPISGSAYTYAYASVGELFAWIIGWDLVLEYTIGASTVAVGWTHYLDKLVTLPSWVLHSNIAGFEVNVLAGVAILLLTLLLAIGIKESARFNATIVAVKLGVVLFVILVGMFFINPANWQPFTPFGPDGGMCPVGDFCWDGIFAGAALVFFSYIGFDAVSAAAEEVENPQKNMPIGIIGSLAICTLLYVAVAAVITGMVPYHTIDAGAPLATAFGDVGLGWAENLIGIGGVAGLTTVMLILLLSQPRIFYSMSRDGLLFKWFATVHPKFRTPFNATIVTGCLSAAIAAFAPMEDLHHMVSIGTLFAFFMVCASIMIMRYKTEGQPLQATLHVTIMSVGIGLMSLGWSVANGTDSFVLYQYFPTLKALHGQTLLVMALPTLMVVIPFVKLLRQGQNTFEGSFRCPLVPWVPFIGMACMLWMMVNLPFVAWLRLFAWLLAGMLIYVFYGMANSTLNPKNK